MPPLIRVESNILPTRKLLVVFSALAFALLISFIDQNGIGVALPILGQELGASDTIVWAGTSSLIANTVFQVLYGRISDITGRKTVMLASVFLLAVGDLLCGFARTGPQLYAFRGLAGVGNGGIAALAMIIVSDTVTLERRGKYQGILGACVGIGNVIGPFLAAAIVEHWTWRAFFWITCVLAVLSGVFVALLVPPSSAIDYWGVLSSSIGVILLLIPISGGGIDFAWDSPISLSMLVLGSGSVILFLVIEARWAPMPLLPLRFFSNPPVSAILIQNVFVGVVWYSNLYFLPIYFQTARQWSPTVSAALTIPYVVGQAISSVLSGQYISWRGRYGEVIWVGYALATLGSGFYLVFETSTQPWAIILILLVSGVGVGLIFQPTLVAAQAHTTKDDRAVIISARNFTRSVGGAVGLAISTLVFTSKVARGISSLPPKAQAEILAKVLSPPDLSLLSQAQGKAVLEAYVSAGKALYIIWVVLMGVCLFSCILIKDRGLQRPEDQGAQHGAQDGRADLHLTQLTSDEKSQTSS
ncbi:MFS general substrate transporter [Thozetella sp. PMI_491]|nr:MFS general substrate transporter [Thozetella sp. PMI_491]